MSSAKAKKRKAAQRKRGAAVRAAKAQGELAPEAQEQDVVEEAEAAPEKPARFLEARVAEVGKVYLNWSLDTAMRATGRMRRAPGGQGEEVVFEGFDMHGNLIEFPVKPHYPIRVDNAGVARVMERYNYKRALLDGRIARESRRVAVSSGDVLEDGPGSRGRAAAPGAPRKPRGQVDPRTRCQAGTDSQEFAVIMLDRVKPGKDHRAKSVELITEFLVKRGGREAKACRALAQSWYSTLVRKAPEVYGALSK